MFKSIIELNLDGRLHLVKKISFKMAHSNAINKMNKIAVRIGVLDEK